MVLLPFNIFLDVGWFHIQKLSVHTHERMNATRKHFEKSIFAADIHSDKSSNENMPVPFFSLSEIAVINLNLLKSSTKIDDEQTGGRERQISTDEINPLFVNLICCQFCTS